MPLNDFTRMWYQSCDSNPIALKAKLIVLSNLVAVISKSGAALGIGSAPGIGYAFESVLYCFLSCTLASRKGTPAYRCQSRLASALSTLDPVTWPGVAVL